MLYAGGSGPISGDGRNVGERKSGPGEGLGKNGETCFGFNLKGAQLGGVGDFSRTSVLFFSAKPLALEISQFLRFYQEIFICTLFLVVHKDYTIPPKSFFFGISILVRPYFMGDRRRKTAFFDQGFSIRRVDLRVPI